MTVVIAFCFFERKESPTPPPPPPSSSLSGKGIKQTYVCGLSVVLQVPNIPCQTEVSDFHDIVFTDKDISSSKITMDTLYLENNREKVFCYKIKVLSKYSVKLNHFSEEGLKCMEHQYIRRGVE